MNIFERKYQIVDEQGNFYKIGEYDSLVIAENSESAECFDIMEANKRINNSKKAKQLRTIAVNPQKKTSFSWEQEDDDEFCMEEFDFIHIVKQLHYIYQHVRDYQSHLADKQNEIEQEICDILHFVEFYECDDEKSIELIAKLHDCRSRRRKVKDEIYKLETFTKIFGFGGMEKTLNAVNRQFDNMGNREYLPRQLHALFEGAVKLSDFQGEELAEEMNSEEIVAEEIVTEEMVAEEELTEEKLPEVFGGISYHTYENAYMGNIVELKLNVVEEACDYGEAM